MKVNLTHFSASLENMISQLHFFFAKFYCVELVTENFVQVSLDLGLLHQFDIEK